jgi:hypothetical protein
LDAEDEATILAELADIEQARSTDTLMPSERENERERGGERREGGRGRHACVRKGRHTKGEI